VCKQRTGNLVDAALATANEAEILADQGRLDEAEAGFRDALRVWQSVGYRRRVAFATMHIGRVASRRGDFDEAQRLLTGARTEFIALDAVAEALETQVWITECLLLQGQSRDALRSAEEGLQREATLGGAAAGTIRAALHRLRGYAFAQLGQTVDAWAELDESLAAARARGASYELALTLEAVSVIAPLAGRPYRPSEEEHRLVLDRLGVKSLPVVPLPEPSAI
jgi:tetratricopeptide (TPR) repeat protein